MSRHRLDSVTRTDWLLLFICYEGAPEGLDPIRLQKGMFLFAQEAPVADDEKCQFNPYNYGPMSTAIYTDLEWLLEEGLIEQASVEGQAWSRYRPTTRGIERAHRL